jgi:SAM-dependent methyltransferase
MRPPFQRLRRLIPGSGEPDLDAELRWWLDEWEPVIREGGFNPGDVPAFLPEGEQTADTYEGRRWQIARAEVIRVLQEAQIEDQQFFEGKVVVDIGSGPLGFPDACPAKLAVAIEPLADRYRSAGLLLNGDNTLYLATGAEQIPLLTDSTDVVLARNSLDHVSNPTAVVNEILRILKPAGTLILSVDVGHPATATEPHSFTREEIRALFNPLDIVTERTLDEAHGGGGGSRLVIVARRR